MERISEEITVIKRLRIPPQGKKSVGKPRKRWLDKVQNDAKKIDVRSCRKMTMNRAA